MDILYNVVEVFKHLCIYVFGFNMQITASNSRKILATALTVVTGILMHMDSEENLLPILVTSYILLVSYLLIRDFTWKRAMIAIWSIGVILAIDTISYVIINFLCSSLGVPYIEIYDLLGSLITLLILLLLFYLIRRKSKINLQEPSVGFCIVFLVLCYINVYILVVFERDVGITDIKYILIYIMLIVGSLMQMAFVLLVSTLNSWHKENERIKEQSMMLQIRHYQYLEQKNSETRRFRHDMRHHLYRMKEYVQDGQLEALGGYLDSISGKLEHVPNYISVQNDTVDAILNYFSQQFKKNEVSFTVIGNMPEQCDIDAYDLSTIFANILSNALEAAVKTIEKRVELTIRSEKGILFIAERNTFNGILRKNGELLLTTKNNKEMHGLGIGNIRECVEKYEGELVCEVDNQEYVLSIVMEYIKETERQEGYEDCCCR